MTPSAPHIRLVGWRSKRHPPFGLFLVSFRPVPLAVRSAVYARTVPAARAAWRSLCCSNTEEERFPDGNWGRGGPELLGQPVGAVEQVDRVDDFHLQPALADAGGDL